MLRPSAIVTGRLFDGVAFREAPTRIDLADGRIQALRAHPPGEALPDGAIDARGATVLPGLIDAHCHIGRAGQFEADEPPNPGAIVHNLVAALAGGVTTVGDMGGPAALTSALGRAADKSPLAGPAVRAAGPILTAPGGYPLDWLPSGHRKLGVVIACPDEDSGRRAVARVARAGMSHVKIAIMHQSYAMQPLKVLPPKVARAIVEEAHRLGLRVCAHAHWAADYRMALEAGVDALMHSSFDPLDDELVRRVADAGVMVCPTMWVFHSACLGAEQRWDRDPLRSGKVVAAVARSWRQFCEAYQASGDVLPAGIAGGLPKQQAKQGVRVAAANLQLLQQAGVPLAHGSDGPFGFSVIGRPLDELGMLSAAGLDVESCLGAATSGAAALLGCADRGRIEVGLRADLLVADGDPRRDLGALARPRAVLRAGVVVAQAGSVTAGKLTRAGAVARGLGATVAAALRQGLAGSDG